MATTRDQPQAKSARSATTPRTGKARVKKTTTTTTKTKTRTITTVTRTSTLTSYQDEHPNSSNLDVEHCTIQPTVDLPNDLHKWQWGYTSDPSQYSNIHRPHSHPPLVLSPKSEGLSSDSDFCILKDEVLDGDDTIEHVFPQETTEPPSVMEGHALATILPPEVPPRPAIRDQLFSLFLSEMLTKSSVSRATSKRGMSYVAELLTLDLSSSVLEKAIEAHCLAFLGSSRKDKDAVRDAESSYGRVLHLLSRAIDPQAVSRPNRPANIDRAIITSIMLAGLHMCARASWHTHYLGVHQYLMVRGPDALDLDNHFDRLLFGELRLPLLLIGLANRKALVFDRPEWRRKIEAQKIDSSAWYSMVMPLPTLLDRVDRLLKESPESPHVADRLTVMCTRLESLRDNITHWLHAISPYAGTAPQVVDIADDDGFNSDVEEHCFMASSTAFDSYYRFPIVPLVFFPMNAWLMNLILECTLLRILHSPFFVDEEKEWPINRDMEAVHHDASILARNLCRCVHAFSQLPSMVDASFLSVCTELVRTFYEESEDIQRMGWCQACAIATEIRISRMKAASEQGALVVDYLKQGIGGAARWKSHSFFYSAG